MKDVVYCLKTLSKTLLHKIQSKPREETHYKIKRMVVIKSILVGTMPMSQKMRKGIKLSERSSR